jgi:hypothetical protein
VACSGALAAILILSQGPHVLVQYITIRISFAIFDECAENGFLPLEDTSGKCIVLGDQNSPG